MDKPRAEWMADFATLGSATSYRKRSRSNPSQHLIPGQQRTLSFRSFHILLLLLQTQVQPTTMRLPLWTQSYRCRGLEATSILRCIQPLQVVSVAWLSFPSYFPNKNIKRRHRRYPPRWRRMCQRHREGGVIFITRRRRREQAEVAFLENHAQDQVDRRWT